MQVLVGTLLTSGQLKLRDPVEEQIVPIITSHPLTDRHAARHRSGARNSDLHDLVLNGVA